jgi:hypothetical protein
MLSDRKQLWMIIYWNFLFLWILINSKDPQPDPVRNWIRIRNSEFPDPDLGGLLITDPQNLFRTTQCESLYQNPPCCVMISNILSKFKHQRWSSKNFVSRPKLVGKNSKKEVRTLLSNKLHYAGEGWWKNHKERSSWRYWPADIVEKNKSPS